MDDLERRVPNANELLDRVVDICPFPAAAQRLMVLANDEAAPLEAIAAAVAADPALATQVLRVANSAAFRQAGADAVRDLRLALVTIGLEELRTMAGAMALLSTFATRDELSLDLHRTSAVSGSIASATVPIVSGTSRGLPFICGLLCEVGALACLVVDGPGYVEVWQRTVTVTGRWSPSAPKARDDLETKRYGATTRTIGARLLRRHRLPDVIANVLEATPWQTPDAPLLHRAVAFARVATPLVAAAQAGQTKIALTEQLAAVARWISLGELAPEELARRCIAAANIAERSVRAVRG